MSMNNTVSFRDGNNIDNYGDNIRSNPDKSRARNVTNDSAKYADLDNDHKSDDDNIMKD